MWRGIFLYVQARNIRTPSWQDLSYAFPFKLTAHPSPFTGQIGQLTSPTCLPAQVFCQLLWLGQCKALASEPNFTFFLASLSVVAWQGYLCGLSQGGECQGVQLGGPPQGGPIPAPLEPLSKAGDMLPSSRLIGWWVTAAFIDTAPRPKADGSKEIKYNTACC